jgi:hypothetical protein
MFNVQEVLYGALDTFAKVYGLKIVIKVCQQFIIDSVTEVAESAPAPSSNAAPTGAVKKPE